MLTIGSRGSDLALVQSRFIATQLQQHNILSRIKIIKTQGDSIQNLSFDKMEGKHFFTKEIEEALLLQQIDLAVHSLKDVGNDNVQELLLAAIPKRFDARDCLVMQPHAYDPHATGPLPLQRNMRVGSSAIRRKTQLRYWREDLQVVDLRGNVPTRLQRLQQGDYDAIVLAYAGLLRLDIAVNDHLLIHPLPIDTCVPAPGQGALGLQICTAAQTTLMPMMALLHHAHDAACVHAERQVLAYLGGGCHAPVGVYVQYIDAIWQMHFFLGDIAAPHLSKHVVLKNHVLDDLVMMAYDFAK